jgi:hypothetical protein
VYENEPPERAKFGYQLRLHFWHGNSSSIASLRSGVTPFAAFLHGANSLRRALFRPVTRLGQGQRPQFRYCLASVLHAFGKLSGALGIKVAHK